MHWIQFNEISTRNNPRDLILIIGNNKTLDAILVHKLQRFLQCILCTNSPSVPGHNVLGDSTHFPAAASLANERVEQVLNG